MITGSLTKDILCGLLLVGAGLFLYMYHVRTRRFDASDREQVTSWGFYVWIDWYLKLSTLGIAILSIQSDAPWLMLVHDQAMLRWLGLLVAAVALLIFAWAMKTLDTQFTPAHQSRLPERVIQTGPYRFIRHPIYTSNVILLCGMFLFSGSLWMVVNLAILLGYYVPTIIVEEKAIRRHLEEYDAYANRTGRFLPRLRSATPKEPRRSEHS